MELRNARNQRNARIFCSVFAAIAGIGLLHWASPVEARSVSGPAVPRRFFSMLAVPGASDGMLLQAPAGDQKAADQPGALPEGKGKALTQKDCVMCHAISVVTKQHHTRDQWRSVLDNMIDKGLDAPDSDLDIIADYLAVNFGPVKSATPSPAPDAAPAPAPQ
jgi:hypothetical protein